MLSIYEPKIKNWQKINSRYNYKGEDDWNYGSRQHTTHPKTF